MTSLVDLLAEDGVKLTGTGTNRLGLCPFHEDTTSSFNVNPDKGEGGVYFCHGCGAKGNAYSYLTDEARPHAGGGHGDRRRPRGRAGP